jgi:hypothetical protein
LATPSNAGASFHRLDAAVRPHTIFGSGYDLVGSDGGVFVFPSGLRNGVGFYGSLPELHIAVNNIVGITPTNSGGGYDLVGSDGGVFVFPVGQPSGFFGSLPGLGISVKNIVGITPTNSGGGYDLVGSDGGVFVFPLGQPGGFFGSLPQQNIHVNNIVGIAATPDDKGYWLLSTDGNVYWFGNAQNYGDNYGPCAGGLQGYVCPQKLAGARFVGIASTQDGLGYWIVTSTGQVLSFGDAPSLGQLPGGLVNNIVSIVPTFDGKGYWLIGSDGGVYTFPDATFMGSLPGLGIRVNNIVGAVPTLLRYP